MTEPLRKPITPGFDVQAQKWTTANENLHAIAPAALTPALIEQAFAHSLVWSADALVQEWNEAKIVQYQSEAYIDSAVLMPLVNDGGQISVLLTKRSEKLYHHPGQISFPGGRVEEGDINPQHTALRETFEEIGVPTQSVTVLGQLPEFYTGTGFLLRPYVGWLDGTIEIKTDKVEVAEVFQVPLAFLMDPANHRLHHAIQPDGKERYYYSMPWKGYFIWGATANVIRNFYHRMLAVAPV
ncbi:NUDIX hydrolase [Advenella kashmirensis W13003]|uniref:NUDIX hydrolase n=1 Tax=Advenella kashmirensis W13003 TaxID=1424334 RepID=V8QRM1_9BURK|nr:CoA pyrophosphatase [Advenella kashmirensis]ETF02287.1 NUDIX hydrolase [Advenella kashmirensis W13003]